MLCVSAGSQKCQKKMRTMELDITVMGLMSMFPWSLISGFYVASSSYYLDEDMDTSPSSHLDEAPDCRHLHAAALGFLGRAELRNLMFFLLLSSNCYLLAKDASVKITMYTADHKKTMIRPCYDG